MDILCNPDCLCYREHHQNQGWFATGQCLVDNGIVLINQYCRVSDKGLRYAARGLENKRDDADMRIRSIKGEIDRRAQVPPLPTG